CSLPFANDVSGKIALIDRGVCLFADKVHNAELSGAIGVIIANNEPGVFDMGATNPPPIAIGALMVSLQNGNTIKNQLNQGTVNATILRRAALDRDGTIDNAIVAHEWNHYMSGRLIGDASGLGAIQSRGMNEGWSDFGAMLMMV